MRKYNVEVKVMGNNVSKKFGARTLSEEEVKLTLPTYDKILEQIEDMRNDEWDEEKSRKSQNQKINNISILGARGTGKTSILKTLIARLEKDNDKENKEENLLGKNIILPMIVPENRYLMPCESAPRHTAVCHY